MRTIIAALLCAAVLSAADASRRAPGFSLPDLNAQQHDLADYRGKVVVLEFMQTTCPHCNAFTSTLGQMRQRYGDRVQVISVVNPPDNQTTVKGFITSHQISYPILFDCGQVAYSYLKAASFDIPHVYVIDQNGGIRHDLGYSDATKNVFEGNGLFPLLDGMVGKK